METEQTSERIGKTSVPTEGIFAAIVPTCGEITAISVGI
jgi:hypothetical protein